MGNTAEVWDVRLEGYKGRVKLSLLQNIRAFHLPGHTAEEILNEAQEDVDMYFQRGVEPTFAAGAILGSWVKTR